MNEGMIKKDYTFSLIRLVALILIIFCHIFEKVGANQGKDYLVITGNLFSVGVQVFLILSGYLYGSRKNIFEKIGRWDFIIKNTKKVLLNYYIYLILFAIPVYYVLKPESITGQSLWKVLTFSGTIKGINHFWYIPYIIACYIFTPMIFDLKEKVCEKINTKYRNSVKRCHFTFSYIINLILILLVLAVVSRAFRVYFSPAWIGCYIIGFFLPEILTNKRSKKLIFSTVVIMIISIILNIIKYYVRYIWRPQFEAKDWRYIFCTYYIEWSRVFFGLALFLSIMLIGNYIFRVKGVEKCKFLDWTDKYSFDIYIVHMIYIKGVLSLLKLTSSVFINLVIIIFVILSSAVALNYICKIVRKMPDFIKNYKQALGEVHPNE